MAKKCSVLYSPFKVSTAAFWYKDLLHHYFLRCKMHASVAPLHRTSMEKILKLQVEFKLLEKKN